jgi:hypothetical protein
MKHTISADRRTLTITVDEDERIGFKLWLHESSEMSGNQLLCEAFEPLICNSELDWASPEEFGDLTDAPMLGIHDSGGKLLERWAYMGYQIRCPVEELAETGKVVFTS